MCSLRQARFVITCWSTSWPWHWTCDSRCLCSELERVQHWYLVFSLKSFIKRLCLCYFVDYAEKWLPLQHVEKLVNFWHKPASASMFVCSMCKCLQMIKYLVNCLTLTFWLLDVFICKGQSFRFDICASVCNSIY